MVCPYSCWNRFTVSAKHYPFDNVNLSTSGICIYIRAYSQLPIRARFYLQGGQYWQAHSVQSQINTGRPLISCLSNHTFTEWFRDLSRATETFENVLHVVFSVFSCPLGF